MLYQTFEPPPELAHCVRSFWVFEGSATETEPYVYRGYADGGTELIFHYRSIFDMLNPDGSTDPGFDAGLHAQTDTFMRCVVRSSFGIFGCYLYPFAVPLLFGCAATDVTGLMTPIDQLLGVRGSHLAEKIFSARDVLQRIQILSRFISDQLSLQNKSYRSCDERRANVDQFRSSHRYRAIGRPLCHVQTHLRTPLSRVFRVLSAVLYPNSPLSEIVKVLWLRTVADAGRRRLRLL